MLIGVDIGTTNLKVLATTARGRVLKVVSRPMVIHRPQPGWADFDVPALEASALGGLREVVAALPERAEVAAITVDSIGESFLGVDAAGAVVTRCPTWFDRRTRNARAELGIDERKWYEVTGLADDDIATFHRLRWMQTEGEITPGQVRRWMNVADYGVFLLSGTAAAAPSLAARSGLYDRRHARWSDELLGALGLDPDWLPAALPAGSVAGGLRADVARHVGLRAGTPIINGGHDHPCAGVGCRVIRPGSLLDSTGTAEAVKTVVAGPIGFDETLSGRYDCYPHSVPGWFMVSGHLPSAGGFLAWTARLLRPEASGVDVEAFYEEALASPPGAGGVRTLPFLEGTGAPFNRRDQAAEALGLRGFHGPPDLLRAAYEGCAFWLAVNVDALSRIVGGGLDEVVAVGGGSRSDFWLELKSAFLGRPLQVPEVDEAAAFGAALVGGMAVGAVLPDLAGVVAPPTRVVEAPEELRVASEPVLNDYQRLYRQRFGEL